MRETNSDGEVFECILLLLFDAQRLGLFLRKSEASTEKHSNSSVSFSFEPLNQVARNIFECDGSLNLRHG